MQRFIAYRMMSIAAIGWLSIAAAYADRDGASAEVCRLSRLLFVVV